MPPFKFNENLPGEAAEMFRQAGYDALGVLDQRMGGHTDRRLAEVCKAEGRALVTLDLDFADIRVYPPLDYAGIIVLRPHRQDKPHVLWLLRRLLTSFKMEPLAGTLWIVDEATIRVHE